MVPLPDGMGAKALYKAHVVPIVESFHQNLSAPMKLRPPTIPVWRNTHPNVTDHPGRVRGNTEKWDGNTYAWTRKLLTLESTRIE